METAKVLVRAGWGNLDKKYAGTRAADFANDVRREVKKEEALGILNTKRQYRDRKVMNNTIRELKEIDKYAGTDLAKKYRALKLQKGGNGI